MGSTRARIADAMGGDHAPAEIVTGAGTGGTGRRVLLVGDPSKCCLAATDSFGAAGNRSH